MTGGCPFTDPRRLFQDLAVTRAEPGLSTYLAEAYTGWPSR